MTFRKTLALVAALTPSIIAQNGAFPNCAQGPLASNGVCDTSLDPWTRAMALVEAMTLEEKIANSEAESPGIQRLGLPKYTWWNEALHGVARSRGVSFNPSGDFSYATSFPQPITMGAAFDMALVEQFAEVTSTEARAFNNAGRAGLTYWTPNINPYRDPRWGRGMEVPSEDAFFMSTYVKHLIPAMQGGLHADPYFKIVATCKHYAGYDMENWQGNARYGFDAKITMQDLRDYHLLPFQTCARDVNAQSIMCAYNAVNGVPTCADPWLMNSLLRTHWNWTEEQQFVTSDCDSLNNVFQDHRYKGMSAAQVAAETLNAGCDLDCGDFWPRNLGQAFRQNLFDIKRLDESIARRFAAMVRLGYFDPRADVPYRQIGWSEVATPDARALALRAATEGLVLLKNTGALPIERPGGAVRTVAVVGPLAGATTQMQGNYFGIAQGIVSPQNGFKEAGYTVVNSAGQADVIVFVGGIDVATEAEDKDRNDITWPSQQLNQISQLAQQSGDKPFIVVQLGTMLDSSEILRNDGVDGLIWGGYPGQDGGKAIADIVSGVSAPAGRLPVTQYPGSYTRDVRMTDMNLLPGTGNPGRTYKWYTGTPVFEFGYGLHYTNFTVSFDADLMADLPATFNTADLVAQEVDGVLYKDLLPFASIPVTVTNEGELSSDFVVLAFLKGEYGPLPYPNKSLVAFTRVHDVAPGESAKATMDINIGTVARSDEAGDLVLFPGKYKIVLDIDDRDVWEFSIEGEQEVLDSWPAR
ncbi:related to xylan 1,4-beta-xylosidase [Cephalotrichum gorgonifer]|uniref:xylan 1,4-beta-xylosidase n=1 Tax=Cephalotrichum gorgonifer TaxID=2041049 RepID=A0AAE8STH8_9PEZI|nr:related to xylan 1,4-beta-xylosidase [Cephalotrichum gorgonifer]